MAEINSGRTPSIVLYAVRLWKRRPTAFPACVFAISHLHLECAVRYPLQRDKAHNTDEMARLPPLLKKCVQFLASFLDFSTYPLHTSAMQGSRFNEGNLEFVKRYRALSNGGEASYIAEIQSMGAGVTDRC